MLVKYTVLTNESYSDLKHLSPNCFPTGQKLKCFENFSTYSLGMGQILTFQMSEIKLTCEQSERNFLYSSLTEIRCISVQYNLYMSRNHPTANNHSHAEHS